MDVRRCVDGFFDEVVLKARKQASLENEHCHSEHHAQYGDDRLSLLADQMHPCNLDQRVISEL
jgi:hypothetical protein